MTRTYGSPDAFKTALEVRLKNHVKARATPISVNRMRQRFVMERFLARAVHVFGSTATLKGGLALELRLSTARSTKDIDLRATGDAEAVLELLQRAAAIDLNDRLVFRAGTHPRHSRIEEATYDGRRFLVAATLASRPYGDSFGVDVSMGDPMYGPTETFVGEDFLNFVGVAPLRVEVYPVETHIAEKLHAYTKPPKRPGDTNSRMKDLPDLAILASVRAFSATALRAAFALTFDTRETHPVPDRVPPPPASWADDYLAFVEEHGLGWATIGDVHAAAAAFLDPVLAQQAGTWDHVARVWR